MPLLLITMKDICAITAFKYFSAFNSPTDQIKKECELLRTDTILKDISNQKPINDFEEVQSEFMEYLDGIIYTFNKSDNLTFTWVDSIEIFELKGGCIFCKEEPSIETKGMIESIIMKYKATHDDCNVQFIMVTMDLLDKFAPFMIYKP